MGRSLEEVLILEQRAPVQMADYTSRSEVAARIHRGKQTMFKRIEADVSAEGTRGCETPDLWSPDSRCLQCLAFHFRFLSSALLLPAF